MLHTVFNDNANHRLCVNLKRCSIKEIVMYAWRVSVAHAGACSMKGRPRCVALPMTALQARVAASCLTLTACAGEPADC